MLESLKTQCVWYDFGMSARVSTLWYFLQWIIENRCFKLRECARMVFFAEDEGGITGIPWRYANNKMECMHERFDV